MIKKMNKPMINEDILDFLTSKNTIVILPHINPDGDAIGSSIALKIALKKLGNDTYIVLNDQLPANLRFINNNDIINYNTFVSSNISPEVIITIDSSDIDRVEDRSEIIDLTDNIINIDHHITNTHYGRYNIVIKNAAATGEIIYNIIKELNIDIDSTIASNLYVAISTDTGSFKYSNTTPYTHKIVSDLLDKGINIVEINTELYQNRSINKVQLLSDTLNTLEFFYNNELSIMYISRDMLKKNKLTINDTDGIIEYARDIENVKAAVLLKELSPNEIKLGLRSKYDTDVSKIAKRFHGGGHKNASGCTIRDSLKNAKQLIIKEFKKELR